MIYAMQPAGGGPIKLGFTTNLAARRTTIQSTYGREMVVLWHAEGDREDEKALLSRFAHLRFGRTEQFLPGRDLLAFIGRMDAAPASEDECQFMEPVANRASVKIDAEAMYYAKIAASNRGIGVGQYLDLVVGKVARAEWEKIKNSKD